LDLGAGNLIDLRGFLQDLRDTKENKELLKGQGPKQKMSFFFFLCFAADKSNQGGGGAGEGGGAGDLEG
jgi:hypothetical protein